jgi:hypothetical protein
MIKIASSNISLSVFDRVHEAEFIHFLLKLLASPELLVDYIRKEAGSVILKIAYDASPLAHGNDPFVTLIGTTMEQTAEATVPGR